MKGLIGDRTGKSALDEMIVSTQEFNEQCREEEKRKAAKKAEEEAERKAKEAETKNKARTKAPSAVEEPVIVPAGNIIPASYKGIEFEPKAPRDGDDKAVLDYNKSKALLTYNKSLARIKKAGFERHPSPSEVFTLLADNLEGKLQPDLKAVADDLLFSYGEWLSMAFERKGDRLVCYLHPERLVWNNAQGIYEKKGFKYGSKQEFNISGKKSEEGMPLKEFEDEFIKLFYGRSFKDLPKQMKQGANKALVYLPPDKAVWPVVRNSYSYRFHIGGLHLDWASRGVRVGGSK